MQDTQYKGINTLIRVYETKLLTSEDYEKMLRAENLQLALDVLKNTDYYFDEKEVIVEKNFEQFLMTRLQELYHDLYEMTPENEVVQIFTLRYSYHNAKVLLKQRFKEIDLEDLLIPIGKYEISSLRNLIKSEQSELIDPIMIEAVQGASKDFETYGRIEAVDVFMDTYYYKHIRAIADQLDNPTISSIVDVMIDLDNLSTVIRSKNQKKSRSFLHTVLSSSGSISKQAIIDTYDQGSNEAIEQLYLDQPYANRIEALITDSTDGINPITLEKVIDEIVYDLMQEAQFQAFGPMPLMAFMFAIEKEVTNIRLILVGKDNQIAEETIRERMRPIYGS